TITVYLDGTSVMTVSNGANQTDGYCQIGIDTSSSSSYAFQGYFDCFRIVNGSPVYTSGFTPSTTALTAITNTTLLLQFDGTLTDTSTSGLTITNTNVALTPVPKIGTGCVSFGGVSNTANYLTAPATAITAVGAGNFTVEGWYWPVNNAVGPFVLLDTRASSASANGFSWSTTTSGYLQLYTNNAYAINSSTPHTLNTWNHIALVRNGTTLTMYLNGVSVGSATNSANFSDAYCSFGRVSYTAANYFPGWFDELRISNTARYTTGFTPSTTAFTSDANTLLLLHFDSLNNDVGNYAVPVSFYGAPFANPVFGTACARFNGSSSVTGPTNNANYKFAGDFTIEAWVMPLNYSTHEWFFCNDSAAGGSLGCGLRANAGTGVLCFDRNGGTLSSSAVVPIGKWSHVAVSRNSNVITLYLNGVSVASETLSTNFSVGNCNIGYSGMATQYFTGYIDCLRINNTTGLYPTGFTVPSSALTAVSGTTLLLQFDGSFVDTGLNVQTMTNNGAVCVAPKFGTGAMFFDGSTNYAKGLTGPWCQFSGNFTVDFWAYCNVLPVSSAYECFFDTRLSAAITGIGFYLANSAGTQQF
ncbi:MAG: LamG domain-containing protein, partial [Rhodospirillaceae bacterium]